MNNNFTNQLSQLMWEKQLAEYITKEKGSGEKLEDLLGFWLNPEPDRESPFMPDKTNDMTKAFVDANLGGSKIQEAFAQAQAQNVARGQDLANMQQTVGLGNNSSLNNMLNARMTVFSQAANGQSLSTSTIPQFNTASSSNIVTLSANATTDWSRGGTSVSYKGSIDAVNAGKAIGNAIVPVAQQAVNRITSSPVTTTVTPTPAPTPANNSTGRSNAQASSTQTPAVVARTPPPAVVSNSSSSSSGGSSGRARGSGANPF